ncbi:hypothetical protein LIER_43904 [Lithospermum erythrorhizon]|uniref:Uncharacterized protein n=1 Tax=Lithospermum erythrorhizon TaxID=34254 RepID=A0AAV3R735_LITER
MSISFSELLNSTQGFPSNNDTGLRLTGSWHKGNIGDDGRGFFKGWKLTTAKGQQRLGTDWRRLKEKTPRLKRKRWAALYSAGHEAAGGGSNGRGGGNRQNRQSPEN